MASTIKVDNIQNQCGANIIKEDSNTITLGASGDTVTLASGASQTGFGRTGTVDWDTTPKTSAFTAVSGNGYFVNTTSGSITVTFPAGSANDIISLADYAGTWQTNSVTVTPNGTDKMGGLNVSVTLNTEGQSVTFVYVDDTQGWVNVQDSTSNVRGDPNLIATGGTITTCGDYKIHTFTGPGTFTVSNTSSTPANNTVSYMVVAGGGGAGCSGGGGGGGGAGGFREYKSSVDCYSASPLNGNPGGTAVTVTTQAYPIQVGGGGPGTGAGGQGTPSVFSTITSTGGGLGGREASKAGGPGGSGGGGGYTPSTAGSGNTPPVSPPQGNNGGGDGGGSPGYGGSGGGGASASGTGGGSTVGGNGGNGIATSISGSPVTRAGGGGGASRSSPGPGGSGGGGNGAGGSGNSGNAGTVNTGGGAGAGADNTGGAGGSGIVIIRYKFQ